MFPYAYKLKNKFQLEEEGIGIIFLWDVNPAAIQDCIKCPSLITNVLVHVVKDTINGACYQRYGKRLEQQKGRPNVKVCPIGGGTEGDAWA